MRQTIAGGATTDFLYDGDRLSAEYVGATLARRYVFGPGVDEPLVWYEGAGTSDRRYLIADHQGSVIAEDGAAVVRNSYGPYGEPNAWTGAGGAMLSRFRYTGQAALPQAQLYHYKGRAYDPALGRFLQTDPVGYEDDLNLYAYVRNDPLNLFDPTGQDAIAVRYLDQEIHAPRDWPYVGGRTVARGHSGVVNINEASGLTIYREYGRYGLREDATVRRTGVSDLQFENGVPTVASVEALLSDLIRIGAAAGSRDIHITWNLGTNFQRTEAFQQGVIQDDPDWSWPTGMNCHSFCDLSIAAGGGNGPRVPARLNSENVSAVSRRIVREYERQAARRTQNSGCQSGPLPGSGSATSGCGVEIWH